MIYVYRHHKVCPLCGTPQTYATEKILKAAIKANKPCKKCSSRGSKNGMFGKSHSESTKKIIGKNTKKCQTGKSKSAEWKLKASTRMIGNTFGTKQKGKKLTEEHKAKLRRPFTEEHKVNLRGPRPAIAGKNNPMYGKIRHDFRLRFLDAYKKTGRTPTAFYNPTACEEIDKFGKDMNYMFQHALNGGEYHIKELGYWVDGYDAKNNIVVEYDELHHQQERRKQKDLVRQQLIIDLLKCKFIRLSEQVDGSIEVKHIN